MRDGVSGAGGGFGATGRSDCRIGGKPKGHRQCDEGHRSRNHHLDHKAAASGSGGQGPRSEAGHRTGKVEPRPAGARSGSLWLDRFRGGSLQSQEFRRKVIDAFVSVVYLSDDHLRIAFNYSGGSNAEADFDLVMDAEAAAGELSKKFAQGHVASTK